MEILRKISSKTLLGGPSKTRELLGNNKKVPVWRVIGIARSTREGSGDNGPWTCLVGTFEATVLTGENKGEVFQSPKLFLPQPMDQILYESLQAEDADAIEFALEVGIERDDSAAVGYVYTTKPLIEGRQADPLADLRGSVPALQAPEKPAEESKPTKAAAKK